MLAAFIKNLAHSGLLVVPIATDAKIPGRDALGEILAPGLIWLGLAIGGHFRTPDPRHGCRVGPR